MIFLYFCLIFLLPINLWGPSIIFCSIFLIFCVSKKVLSQIKLVFLACIHSISSRWFFVLILFLTSILLDCPCSCCLLKLAFLCVLSLLFTHTTCVYIRIQVWTSTRLSSSHPIHQYIRVYVYINIVNIFWRISPLGQRYLIIFCWHKKCIHYCPQMIFPFAVFSSLVDFSMLSNGSYLWLALSSSKGVIIWLCYGNCISHTLHQWSPLFLYFLYYTIIWGFLFNHWCSTFLCFIITGRPSI